MVTPPDEINVINSILNYIETYTLMLLMVTGYYSKHFATSNSGRVGK